MGRKRHNAATTNQWDDSFGSSHFFDHDNVIPLPINRKSFKQLTPNHHRLVYHIKNSPITLINGPAGSLKTFLTLQTSLSLIDAGHYDKLVYIRQNIQRPREKVLGSLPGDKGDKLSPLLNPIRDNLDAILSPYELASVIESGSIEATDIENLRGRSPLRSILFCDEAQNCDLTALETVMTRRTECSKLVLAGDFKSQRDILDPDFDGYELVCKEFDDVFPVVNLTKSDILRSETNKDVINGFERIKNYLNSQSKFS